MKINRKSIITPELVQKFIIHNKKGLTLREIAEIESVSPNTVKKYLVLNGEKIRTLNLVYNLKKRDDRLIGLYVGIWCGDGTQYKDRHCFTIKLCCHSKDKELIGFYQNLLLNLFGKTSKTISEKRNRSMVRFYSKFIFNFIDQYVTYEENKTHSVRLKNSISSYSDEFLDGFLLGLMLSDGYLKDKFRFNVTSPGLSLNMMNLLNKYQYSPKIYTHNRKKLGWKNLQMISLNKKESQKMLFRLNQILKEVGYVGYYKGFNKIKGYEEKYGPERI